MEFERLPDFLRKVFLDAPFTWAVIRLPKPGQRSADTVDIDLWCELRALKDAKQRVEKSGWKLTSARGLSEPRANVRSALLRFANSDCEMDIPYLDLHFGELRWSYLRYFKAPDRDLDITRTDSLPCLWSAALLATQASRCALRGNLHDQNLADARATWRNMTEEERIRWRQISHAFIGETGSLEKVLNNRTSKARPGYYLRLLALYRQYILTGCSRHNLKRWFKLLRKNRSGTGIVVSFIGPDGAGKTSLIDSIREEYENGNIPVIDEYWGRSRSQTILVDRIRRLVLTLSGRNNKGNIEKNSVTALNARTSFLNRLLANAGATLYLLDYWWRWLTVIIPNKSRGYTVLLDRGPADLKVMYQASRMARECWRLAPRPDLVINCRASAETIIARKKERTDYELEAQLHDYNQVCLYLNRREHPIVCIDTGNPVDECLDKSRQAISFARLVCQGILDPVLFPALLESPDD